MIFNNTPYTTREWDSTTTALGILILIITSGVATYLQHYQPLHLCTFCTLIRSIFMIVGWLYLWKLLTGSAQWLSFTQFSINLIGLAFSLRQVAFQHTSGALSTCHTLKGHSFKAVWHWLRSGAPVCYTTPTFGPLTLAGWACIAFGLLAGLTGFQWYLQRRQID